jgi:hypothetical protein
VKVVTVVSSAGKCDLTCCVSHGDSAMAACGSQKTVGPASVERSDDCLVPISVSSPAGIHRPRRLQSSSPGRLTASDWLRSVRDGGRTTARTQSRPSSRTALDLLSHGRADGGAPSVPTWSNGCCREQRSAATDPKRKVAQAQQASGKRPLNVGNSPGLTAGVVLGIGQHVRRSDLRYGAVDQSAS